MLRLSLSLKRLSSPCNISMSYQPYIAAAVYDILARADAEYAGFLHDTGYRQKNKRFKYFTFGPLTIPRGGWEAAGGRMLIYADRIRLTVSLLTEQAAQTFVTGLFRESRLRIADKFAENDFEVTEVSALPDKIENEVHTFRTLSPILVKRVRPDERNVDYLSPEDEGYEEIFLQNLTDKYLAYTTHITGGKVSNHPLVPRFELSEACRPKPKLITIKPNLSRPLKVKGFLFDFRLSAPPELTEVGYFGGFGSNNAQGFGCVRILS